MNYNRIKAVLAEENVASKELAKHLDKTESTVSRWCTNDVQPSVEVLYQIAKFLMWTLGNSLSRRNKVRINPQNYLTTSFSFFIENPNLVYWNFPTFKQAIAALTKVRMHKLPLEPNLTFQQKIHISVFIFIGIYMIYELLSYGLNTKGYLILLAAILGTLFFIILFFSKRTC